MVAQVAHCEEESLLEIRRSKSRNLLLSFENDPDFGAVTLAFQFGPGVMRVALPRMGEIRDKFMLKPALNLMFIGERLKVFEAGIQDYGLGEALEISLVGLELTEKLRDEYPGFAT